MDKLLIKSSVLAVSCALSLASYADIPEKLDPNKLSERDKTAPELSATMQTPEVKDMLRVWNKVNDDLDMKCSECHSSPHALEFSIAGIGEDDIFRRGIVHHSSEDILQLMAGSKILAEALGLPLPGELDRDEVFIMQPGGKPTEGHYYFDRDYSFAKHELAKHTPIFAGHIPDMETALAAWEEFKTLTNPNDIRVPWLSPVYSGDTFVSESRGEKTGTIHKWVSVVPIQPLNEDAAAEIESRRTAYINYPSNEHFDNLFYAVKHGTGPFGFELNEFGRSFGTSGNGQSDGVKNHDMAKDLSPAAADYEMQKYLMGMIAFHTEMQELMGLEPVMNNARGAYNLYHDPDAHFADRSNASRDKNEFLKVGDAAGQTLGDAQLRYPEFVLDNFLGGKFEQGPGAKSKNEVNKHARYGAPDWWHFSLHYSMFTPDGFYWQGDNKLHGPVHTPWIEGVERTRENAMPGYPIYNNWVSLRRHALRGLLKDDSAKGIGIDEFGGVAGLPRHLSGMTNKLSMANDEHWKLALRSLVNYSKIITTIVYEQFESKNNIKGTRKYLNQNQLYVSDIYRYAKELDELEGNTDYREYHTIKAMFEKTFDAANRLYARAYNGEEVEYVRGNGNGLRLEVFDDENFQTKLSDYIVATADHTLHRASSLQFNTWGNNLYSKLGSGRAFDTNYIDGDIDGSSFRFTGFIQVPSTDNWEIWDVAADRKATGVKITIDGQVVYEKSHTEKTNDGISGGGAQFQEFNHGTRTRFCGGEERNVRKCNFDNINPLYLEAGELYAFEMEIYQPAEENDVNTRDVPGTYLIWAAEKTRPAELVPAEYLYSSRDAKASSLPEIIGNELAEQRHPDFGPLHYPDPVIWIETTPGAELDYQFEATSDNGPVRFLLAGYVPDGVSVSPEGTLQGVVPPTWKAGGRLRYNPNRNVSHDFTLVAIDADNEAHQVPVRIENLTKNTNVEPPADPQGELKAILRADATEGEVGLVVEFDGSRSTHPSDGELVYLWSVDGENYEAGEEKKVITFDQTGEHRVYLKVSDGEAESASDYAKVTIYAANATDYEAISIGDIQGSVSVANDVITVTAQGNGVMGKKVRRDHLVFVPLYENVQASGDIRIKVNVTDIQANEFGGIAIRQSYADDDRTYITGRNMREGASRARNFRWTRRVQGKKLGTANGSGKINVRIRDGKAWNVQFEDGFTIGVMVATGEEGLPVSVAFKDLEVSGIN